MKIRVTRRNRRGAVRRGVSFSFFAVIAASTVLGFISQLIHTPAAQAAPSAAESKYRYLLYFDHCLASYLDSDGKAWDNNDRNIEFTSVKEMFKPGEIVAVGLDIDGENGAMSCLNIARKAMFYYLGITNNDEQNKWLMKKVWGEIVDTDNVIKVNSDITKKVEANAKDLRKQLAPVINDAKAKTSHTKRDTLERTQDLFEQCFKNLRASEPSGEQWEDGSLTYDERKIYAQRRRFDWDETTQIQGFKLSNGKVGDIQLNWAAGGLGNHQFNDRSSEWYPIGVDISSVLSDGKITTDSRSELTLSCNIFSAKNTYFFGTGPKDSSTHWIIKNNKLFIVEDKNGDGKISDNEITEAKPKDHGESEGGVTSDDSTGGLGSNNYQCVVTPPLSWIACPIITLMVKALGVLEGGIKNALQVPPLGSDGAFQSLHTTWAAFRDLANAFLVLIFLITIFAQVLPFDVDPYMVKKVLPKIIAAAICIQFSYFFVQVLFDISRVLGAGIGTMIKSLPVGDTGGGFWGQEVGDTTVTSGIGFIGAVAAGGVGLAAAFEAGGLLVVPILLLLLSAIISVITLFVTLQMRMIVLFIMTMIAPLAFLAWILPNTENYFKKWGTTLIKLLLMYPLIVFMIDSANMIAKVSYDAVNAMSKGSSGVGGISDISKLMISAIPIIIYFMIPMTFKWAGGIFGSIANAVQNQGNKWSKQARNNAIMKNSLDDIKTNAASRLPEPDEDKLGFKSAFSRKGFGRLGSRTVSGNIFSFGNSGRRKIEAARSRAEEQLNAGLQVKYRKMNNIRRLQAMLEAEANGNEAEAAAIFDLILKQGGDLEASEYFATLEYEVERFNEKTGKIEFKKNADGTLVRRADAGERVVRSSNGAVESVKSSLWTTMQRNESHAKRLASAVPSSVGKPISKASASAYIDSKGDAPATEFITEARQLAAEGETGKLAEMAQNFTQIIQRENAGEMQEPMVKAWQEVAKILRDNGVETTMLTTDGEVKVYDLIEARSKDNKLQRYVQGTPTGAPVVPPKTSGTDTPPPGPGDSFT